MTVIVEHCGILQLLEEGEQEWQIVVLKSKTY